MSRTYHPTMLETHRTSTLYPDSQPFTVEWWLNMSSFAYLCWQWGQLPHERWAKLDRWIFARAYQAIEAGRFGDADSWQ